jgi:hypothetical protein
MLVRHQLILAALIAGGCCVSAHGQMPPMSSVTPTPGMQPTVGSAPVVNEVVRDGITYRETKQIVEQMMPVTTMKDQQQTVMTPKVSTETVAHQQVYSIPVTQYEVVPVLHGRWNPFAEPYYTYETQLVTRYQEQTVNVQIPVTKSEWVTETKTVQVPVTEYKMAKQEIVTTVALTGGDANKTFASTQSNTQRPVSLQALGSQPATSVASQPNNAYSTAASPLPNNNNYGQANNNNYGSTPSGYGYTQPAYNSTQNVTPPGYNSNPVTPTPAGSMANRPNNQSAIGGQMLQQDPPRQGTGWGTLPNNGSGYR